MDVADSELDALVDHVLPGPLIAGLQSGAVRRLVVVPDDDLWHVPWAHATALRETDVRLLPSLSQHARVRAVPDAPVVDVLAVVDDDAPGAAAVVDALYAARAGGRLRVANRLDIPTAVAQQRDYDLLLFYGHGAGTGLGYRLNTVHGRRTALELARAGGFRSALVAACWSGAAPPPGLTTSLPAALLTAGVGPVIGGLWPLPGDETGRVVAATVDRLATGAPLVAAFRFALEATPVSRECRRGLVVHGVHGDAEPMS